MVGTWIAHRPGLNKLLPPHICHLSPARNMPQQSCVMVHKRERMGEKRAKFASSSTYLFLGPHVTVRRAYCMAPHSGNIFQVSSDHMGCQMTEPG